MNMSQQVVQVPYLRTIYIYPLKYKESYVIVHVMARANSNYIFIALFMPRVHGRYGPSDLPPQPSLYEYIDSIPHPHGAG